VIGIMTNGVLLDSHEATWAYDSCNGHSDKKHQYHYHIPPQCFLQAHDVATPDSVDWWYELKNNERVVRNYTDMAAQWPDEGKASPILGFARDGYSIMGPYDNNGMLQRGSAYGGNLDECNGMEDENGNYAYYLTADPPFAPPCLRGEKGVFTYMSTTKMCPISGIVKAFDDSGAAQSIGNHWFMGVSLMITAALAIIV